MEAAAGLEPLRLVLRTSASTASASPPPGVVWMGTAIQDPQIEEWTTTGILDMMLHHSHVKSLSGGVLSSGSGKNLPYHRLILS
jgi:hypothetical protein